MSVALVTGAARGIGLEVARQLAARGDTVLLGAGDLGRGEAAARELQGDVRVVELDVADAASVERAGAAIASDPGQLDVLVNNAAIHYDTGQSATAADLDVVREALETNLFGAW